MKFRWPVPPMSSTRCTRAGYQVSPIGIAPSGRWLIGGDPMKLLSDNASGSPEIKTEIKDGEAEDSQTENSSMTGQRVGQMEQGASTDLFPSTSHASQLATIDVIFPVLHGPYGEDGTIQGLLEMANLPYVGCGVASSAVAMDKVIAKQLFASVGLSQVKHHVILRSSLQSQPRVRL